MPLEPAAEKAKPFVLVKYFTFISIVVMFLGAIVLSAFNAYWVRSIVLKKSEDYALLLVENLNHQVFMQFVIPVALQYGQIQLRKKEQFERMDRVVRSTLHSFDVENVNIHDMNQVISYSYDKDLVGQRYLGGTAYRRAVSGEMTSNLVQRGNFWEILLGFPKESRLVTYAPMRAEKPMSVISGPILGVVEIVQDLSGEYKEIFRLQRVVIITCSVVMAILFVVLRLTVMRGERIIRQRTEERMQLQEALERARHLSSIGEMIAGVSHEIRNPLGIIRNSAELLQKKMMQLDRANRIPEIIVEEANRLNDILTDFLNYARPISPQLEPCQPKEILEKTMRHICSLEDAGRFELIMDIGEQMPKILADPALLHQAILNLVMNAMQAMPDGGEIILAAGMKKSGLVLTIVDTGPGIASDIQDKIWDPFFTTKEKGTGLGLGIVKNIIKAHRGRIDIENRHNENVGDRTVSGTRVVIEIPLAEEEA